MGCRYGGVKSKSKVKISEFIISYGWQFVKLIGKFSLSEQNLRIFRLYNFFEKFRVVYILTSEDKRFRNSTYNSIEKLWRQTIGVISEPFS